MVKYEYANIDDNTSQYEDYDLTTQKVVDAIYRPAHIKMARGNPYIEALPLPIQDTSILTNAYTKRLPGYSREEISSMSTFDKMMEVEMLTKLRMPLPFQKFLEYQMYRALVLSYCTRTVQKSKNHILKYTAENEWKETDRLLLGNSADSTDAGFGLVGYSGCGKSSAIQILLSHYPQVIRHTDDNGRSYIQIVYLVVNCITNSNFSALYAGIGDAIDKALQNTVPVYEEEIEKARGLGEKAEKIRHYIERFAIGIIIFDEIQLIDFNKTKENSFDSLLTLANRTKVAIGAVGTEDAMDKMFRRLRTARRIGCIIQGSLYCSSKDYFRVLVKSIFRYQWFDEPVEVTKDIIDTLYEVTHGIVNQLVNIYSSMCFDYLDKKKKPVINGDYIRSIAKTFYPGIQAILENMKMSEAERAYHAFKEDAEIRKELLLDQKRQEEEMKEIEGVLQTKAEQGISLENVIANITALYDYSEQQIEEAYKKVINRKSSEGKSEKEISRLVYEQLNRLPKKNQQKKVTQEKFSDVVQMQEFLNI